MQKKMNKNTVTYPEKILPTVRSDMMAYHRHGYSFEDYCDRNTHGRDYGKELYPVWQETLKEFKEGEGNVGVSENRGHEGRKNGQNRGRKSKQHL